MSVLTRSTTSDAPRDRYRFSVEDYHQLIAAGFFDSEDRLELLEGELVMQPPIGPEHSAHTRSLRQLLAASLPPNTLLSIGDPITIPDQSEPQPDFSIVRARNDFYKSAHPQPKDVLLVIEVSDSSAKFDAREKADIYGRAGIPEYWVLDLPARMLRVFTGPASGGYLTQRSFQPGETIRCGSVPSLELTVSEMLL